MLLTYPGEFPQPAGVDRADLDYYTPTLGHATLTWLDARPLAPYELQIRTAGAWRTVATVPATTNMVDEVTFEPVAGDAVRLQIPATRFGGQNPKLAELAVRG